MCELAEGSLAHFVLCIGDVERRPTSTQRRVARRLVRDRATRRPVVLLVATVDEANEDQFAAMQRRDDIDVVHVTDEPEAVAIVARRAVRLVVLGPDVASEVVAHVVSVTTVRRPEAFALVIRYWRTGADRQWQHDAVGVLRAPLVADALQRSVDVLLAMR